MVGRGHEAHSQRRAQQERVKVLTVLPIGEAGEPIVSPMRKTRIKRRTTIVAQMMSSGQNSGRLTTSVSSSNDFTSD
jgi:hypothetical protein